MTIQLLTGFKDILPQESKLWREVEKIAIGVLDSFGFTQIRLPMVERTDLFTRGVGETTDIVEKEMFAVSYTGAKGAVAKGDKSLDTLMSLRPEGTAGCVRAIIEHNMLRGDTPKLWYMGNMFRYERPQKGRYRQFTQLGVESFGSSLPDADAELIAMTALLWQRLGISDAVRLELNSIGEAHERTAFKEALVEYLTAHFDGLDDDSQRRLSTNPLRIFDSKDPQTQDILLGAPKLSNFLGQDSVRHFESVQNYLHSLGIDFVINDKLVRGLDYYNKTVFEWTTDKLGSQATVCGGGRYDSLVSTVQGKQVDAPAVGFAIGLERLVLLVEETTNPVAISDCDVFVVASEAVYMNAMLYAHQLRQKSPDLRVKMASATSLKSQMKKADKSGAKYTVIIGEEEINNGTVSVKNMQTGEQAVVDSDDFGFFDDLTDEFDD